MRLLACLIVAPQRGYDEPAILSYAISSFCPTSADGLQEDHRWAPAPAGRAVAPPQCSRVAPARTRSSLDDRLARSTRGPREVYRAATLSPAPSASRSLRALRSANIFTPRASRCRSRQL